VISVTVGCARARQGSLPGDGTEEERLSHDGDHSQL
jgi:hypothetical protein